MYGCVFDDLVDTMDKIRAFAFLESTELCRFFRLELLNFTFHLRCSPPLQLQTSKDFELHAPCDLFCVKKPLQFPIMCDDMGIQLNLVEECGEGMREG